MKQFIGTLFPRSLKLRLMAAAAIWALPVLLLAGVLLLWASARILNGSWMRSLRPISANCWRPPA